MELNDSNADKYADPRLVLDMSEEPFDVTEISVVPKAHIPTAERNAMRFSR